MTHEQVDKLTNGVAGCIDDPWTKKTRRTGLHRGVRDTKPKAFRRALSQRA